MEITDQIIENILKEMARKEQEECENMIPDIFLYADSPESMLADERKTLEKHLNNCMRCQHLLEEAKIILSEKSEAEISPVCQEILDERNKTVFPGATAAVSFCTAVSELMNKLREVIPEIVKWKYQFAQSEKRTAEEHELESGITIGYREGEYVILLEDSDKNSEKMKKNVKAVTDILKAGTLPDVYRANVLVQNENDQWEFFEEIDELELPVKIRVKDEEKIYDRFILIMDSEIDIENSSEIITEFLNGEEPDGKPSETAVVIIVEVAEKQGGEE